MRRQGVGSFCRGFLCFSTMPCRHMPFWSALAGFANSGTAGPRSTWSSARSPNAGTAGRASASSTSRRRCTAAETPRRPSLNYCDSDFWSHLLNTLRISPQVLYFLIRGPMRSSNWFLPLAPMDSWYVSYRGRFGETQQKTPRNILCVCNIYIYIYIYVCMYVYIYMCLHIHILNWYCLICYSIISYRNSNHIIS